MARHGRAAMAVVAATISRLRWVWWWRWVWWAGWVVGSGVAVEVAAVVAVRRVR